MLYNTFVHRDTIKKINFVSWHRPHQKDLAGPDKFLNLTNLYSHKYFSTYDYLSDSANSWNSEKETKLFRCILHKLPVHLLIHPEWWVYGSDSQGFVSAIKAQLEIQFEEINQENSYFQEKFNLRKIKR